MVKNRIRKHILKSLINLESKKPNLKANSPASKLQPFFKLHLRKNTNFWSAIFLQQPHKKRVRFRKTLKIQ